MFVTQGIDAQKGLSTVFRGAMLILFGFVGGGALTLATQIVLARLLQPEIYGLFSQGMAVLYTLVMFSMMGLNAGISRHISFEYRSDLETARAVGSSLIVVLPFSLLIFGALFLFAGPIAGTVFSDPRMAEVLKIFALAGPAMVVNSIFISGFRGQQSSRERVILLDFIIPLAQVLLVTALILLGYGLGGAVAGYAAAFVFATLVISYWYRRSHEFAFHPETLLKLVKLSWPLMLSSVAVQIFMWSPPLLVGVFSTSKDVGLFNAALPLAASTKMFLSSVAFLYMPVASEIFSNNSRKDLIEVHSTTTRWIAYASLPLLSFLFVFSARTLDFVFGSAYIDAGAVLALMALGYLFNTLTGPVGELLIAVGKTKREMFANILKVLLFLAVGAYLLPVHGIIGAAAAYAAGMAVGNIFRLWFCRRHIGFFYDRDFLKPVAAVMAAFLTTYYLPEFLPILLITWGAAYVSVLAVMKPLNPAEREMIEEFLEDLGIELPFVDELLGFLTS